MSGSKDQAFIEDIRDYFHLMGWDKRYAVHGNVEDHDWTLVVDMVGKDGEPIITQRYKKNDNLSKIMRLSWYHPSLTTAQVEEKLKGYVEGLFLEDGIISKETMRRSHNEMMMGLFDRSIELTKDHKNTSKKIFTLATKLRNELLGLTKTSS